MWRSARLDGVKPSEHRPFFCLGDCAFATSFALRFIFNSPSGVFSSFFFFASEYLFLLLYIHFLFFCFFPPASFVLLFVSVSIFFFLFSTFYEYVHKQ